MSDFEHQKLTILHTNDLHSHFEQVGRLAALIRHERKLAAEDEVILLDIGDHMDRMAVETEGTLGGANVDILNLMGYDGITIGNNEGLTFTPDMLEKTYSDLISPVICSNVREMSTGETPKWMSEHFILHKGSCRIAIIGATAPFTDFYSLLGWEIVDPIQALTAEIDKLKGMFDFLIVCSHLGFNSDRRLAEACPEIDLILGGHTHHLLEEPVFVGNTAICAAGKFGQFLGKVVIERSAETGHWHVVHGCTISVDSGEEDTIITDVIAAHGTHARENLNRTITVIDRTLTVNYMHESAFGNLLAQSVRRFTGSQIAIINAGQLLGNLPQGRITEGMLHSLCPSPINPARLKLKGSDILQSLEQSLLPEYTMKVIQGFGFRGKVLGTLCVDGMEVLFDPDRIPYDRIVEVRVQGQLLDPDHRYDVGTLDLFTFGIGYERLKESTDKQYMLPEFIRDLLRIELQTPGAIDQSFQFRWMKI